MKDEIISKGIWKFDSQVTEVFDDMLKRSIPGFDAMREMTTSIAAKFAISETYILDLGCSKGGAIAKLIEVLDESYKFRGIEISEPMRLEAQERFKDSKSRVEIIDMDLRINFPKDPASVVLSVLTLQFIPIEYRQKIVKQVYDCLIPGGAFILVEKVLGSDAVINEMLVKEYYDLKGKNGYTEEQINTKRRSLEGILVPVTSKWNEEILVKSGFQSVDSFWRNLNFVGWVAIK
jgi:tRNA (cmo5U34)-methyltransferase